MKTLILSLLVMGSTALASPCDTNDFAGCVRDLNEKMHAATTDVREWKTVNSLVAAYWWAIQIHNGFVVFRSNSREHNFLIAVKQDTMLRPVSKGLKLMDAVHCMKFLAETDMKDQQGFDVQVRLYKGVACE